MNLIESVCFLIGSRVIMNKGKSLCLVLIYVISFVSCVSLPRNKKNLESGIENINLYELTDVDFSKGFVDIDYSKKLIGEYSCTNLPSETYERTLISDLCTYTKKYIFRIKKLSKGKLDLSADKEYETLKITYGDLVYQTSPNQFILPKGNILDETVVYHELGHRLMFLIDKTFGLKFGGVSSFLSIGILEYLAASVSDNPLIGKSLLPEKLVRDVSKPYYYPQDLMSVGKVAILFDQEYKNLYQERPYHKRFYELFLTLSKKAPNAIEGHMSSRIISSALWELRKKIGKAKTDQIVILTILKLGGRVASKELKDSTILHFVDGLEESVGSVRDKSLIRKVFTQRGLIN